MGKIGLLREQLTSSGERLPAVFRPESNYKKTRQVLGHTVEQGLLKRIRKVGSRSDLRTRGVIDRILCHTLRQKLTCPLGVSVS